MTESPSRKMDERRLFNQNQQQIKLNNQNHEYYQIQGEDNDEIDFDESVQQNINDNNQQIFSDNDDSFEQMQDQDQDDFIDLDEDEQSPKRFLDNLDKRTKIISLSPDKKSQSSIENDENTQSSYSLEKVVGLMMLKKDRKIPNSVYKPHSEEVFIVVSSFFSNSSSGFQRILFPYPKYCQRTDTAPSFLQIDHPQLYDPKYYMIKVYAQSELKKNKLQLGFKMTDSTHIYNSVVNTMKNAGVRIVAPNTSKWNVTWTGITKPELLREMFRYQRVNHFPQSFHLGRKDLMWKNIYKMKRQYQSDYDICPQTYLLPDDYKKLVADREAEGNKNLYILKPNASSCGKGISVLGPQDPIPKKGGYLVSKYLAHPHLIDGLKYDLRIYVLVTSYDPLKIYLFREGLVRFATEKYSTNPNNLKKRFIHLTNYSVNKKAEGYVRNQDKVGGDNNLDEERSSKWNLLQLKKQFDKLGIDYSQVKGRIKDVIIKTLISVEPHIMNSMTRCTRHRNVCFEVYGFDILLDAKLKPWLLEVNISPSLSSSSPLDKKIKTMLICDTLNLTGVQPFDKKKTLKEQEQQLRNRLLGLNKSPKSRGKSFEYLGGDGCEKIMKIMDQPLCEDELQIIVDYEEEQLRKGNFDLIFPLPLNVPYYSQFFEFPRTGNETLWKYIRILTAQKNNQNIGSQN
ncbi:tubulin-tyrosine ligase family protein [Stylonychia lemnae]|uniref:Tubulin--tyrosine ligase-like protein 5 n=1 Tax=Stylonychia lemnae TaxID=5949 RepID=A0A078B133_STYLE|nr:tubulin-tyrosine ligase family protein [Stylonychia lemnae]|eukprot:CDW86808.1 tubulin-tyrosine ligase family protein [Stylonychia lemnae]